jgi:hypothetical protein
MDPSIWGSCLWKSIHIIAIGYPKNPTYEDIVAYKNFYENFWRQIPCYKCKNNYRRHLKDYPIEDYLKDNKSLFEWTVLLHNVVNVELHKKEMSLEEATKMYRKMIQNKVDQVDVENGKKIFVWIFLLLLIGIIIYIIYSHPSFLKKWSINK